MGVSESSLRIVELRVPTYCGGRVRYKSVKGGVKCDTGGREWTERV